MALQTIPVRNDLPFYNFKVVLSNVNYTLQFRYNGRMKRWIMDVSDSTGNQIYSGAILLIDRDLLYQYSTLDLPPGILVVIDDTGKEQQPTEFSFGLTHSFWYEDLT